jgi:Flp pilus assembly secretin CpaC
VWSGIADKDMTMKAKNVAKILAVLIAAGASAQSAYSAQPLVVFANQTKLMQLAAAPSTIIVGNPSIADVTINGAQVFLHGRNYGTTNLMILDAGGAVLHDYEVTVQEGANNNITIFKGGASLTYACMDDCQPTLRAGDSPDYLKDVASSFKTITAIATGQKASDGTENAPTPAPPAEQ